MSAYFLEGEVPATQEVEQTEPMVPSTQAMRDNTSADEQAYLAISGLVDQFVSPYSALQSAPC